ncbi:50S ribosomal protein L20 [Anaplasma phagocytophilum]|uniref:Large ribosomal subunit protein bL20 n=2 Tax=Anaplasma phagocytophilum TaxID=948 RepID=RL20_ANAPZ|nr:50S ribosomal protein L20 [Anaplasma phagocytophilum]Q2GLQ8.1 RecName: Full=Large ribosomal subunit protein bL20; AltName: Full=50S ribosomal protein L20 [Anaplasma phagocytophilum str. HZ]ABD43283.1 ribosomal protein L20 [Anaplasma phagocytophilum str. HZ]AGR78575.1 50S ribosomal protein L20 [Anaplasma phagocytophilum str. HZ2]KJV68584.1 ribosomal protein L20 [Anaplasma phagocytophilum str. NCH-1]KJV88470.1 ribosomal protein L20 [Anaplasma phagocytophilum str. ApNYW]
MARVKRGVTTRARHKKVIALAKGYRGRSKNCYRAALQRLEKALAYAYRDRRARKRDFRSLWIVRINAAAGLYGLRYSEFMHGVSLCSIGLNRKMLAEMAVRDKGAFEKIAHAAAQACGRTCVVAQSNS